MSALTRAIVHHTAGSEFNTTSLNASKAYVRGVQNLHMDGNGWSDIGYHFLIDKFGNIFEGRSGSMSSLPRGAHDAANTNSFGFTCMGYFHPTVNNVPTSAMLNSLYSVIAWRMPSGWQPYGSPGGTYGNLGYSVGYVDAHRRVVATACPGDGIFNPYMGSNMNSGIIRSEINARITGAGSRYAPSMFYDLGSTMNMYRWSSSGSSFSHLSTTGSGSYSLSNVGQHVAASDVNGDGRTDNVVAYQLTDGTMQLQVFLNGNSWDGSWFQSGAFSMANVAGRMIGGDFDGNGKGDVVLFYKTGATSMTIFRFLSTGSSFTYDTASLSSGYDLDQVSDHLAAANVNGDSRMDAVAAYQYPDGTMRLHVFLNGNSYQGNTGWFQSGAFGMANVGGRMAGGDFDGNGKGDVAMLYRTGTGSMILFRFLSTGSALNSASISLSNYELNPVGNHMAAGDANGDGKADVVTAYQYPDGTFQYHMWASASTGPVNWFQSGSFSLANVGGRLTMGKW